MEWPFAAQSYSVTLLGAIDHQLAQTLASGAVTHNNINKRLNRTKRDGYGDRDHFGCTLLIDNWRVFTSQYAQNLSNSGLEIHKSFSSAPKQIPFDWP